MNKPAEDRLHELRSSDLKRLGSGRSGTWGTLAKGVARNRPVHGTDRSVVCVRQVTAGVTTTEATAVGVASGSPPAGAPESSGAVLSQSTVSTMLSAAVGRRGTPYIWGAARSASFDCSGLVQWSFAQAGVRMRVAVDQGQDRARGAGQPASAG